MLVEQLSNSTLYRPWILSPDLTNKTAAVRSAAATRGVDNDLPQPEICHSAIACQRGGDGAFKDVLQLQQLLRMGRKLSQGGV